MRTLVLVPRSTRLYGSMMLSALCYALFYNLFQDQIRDYSTIRTRELGSLDRVMMSESSPPKYNPIAGNFSASKNETIPVFYNLYVHANATEAEIARVKTVVFDQLANLKPIHHPVYVHSIGRKLLIPNTILLQHHETAGETVTLHSLWNYCKKNIDSKVVYLHSKGSFHPTQENELFRPFLTAGALSAECASLPENCNVCSTRFSPYPHPHTPGNMWLARCEYVSKLLDPLQLDERMHEIPKVRARAVDVRFQSMMGVARFASEHYIHSHWAVQPCDLYTNPNYVHGYTGIPDRIEETDFQLKLAPRFPWTKYIPPFWRRTRRYTNLAHRLEEYQVLYNETPDETFWGWRMDAWLSQAQALIEGRGGDEEIAYTKGLDW
jgi:hypothetical protein